jgi:hypothetical protein
VKILGTDALLGGLTLPTEQVPVPELGGGGFVIVRGLSAFERGRYEQSLIVDNGAGKKIWDPAYGRAELLVRTLVGEDGARLFADTDAARLQGMRADVADRLFSVAKRLSGLSQEDLDELKKACGGSQTADSPSS